MSRRPAVLFVCLGNICRSPLAEAALRQAADEAGLDIAIDSAGTGNWHVGNPPDPRAQATALKHRVDISRLRARQVEAADYTRFSHIFALDLDNLQTLRRNAPPGTSADIALLLDWVEGRAGMAVADPYYGGSADFEEAWADVSAAAAALVAHFSLQA